MKILLIVLAVIVLIIIVILVIISSMKKKIRNKIINICTQFINDMTTKSNLTPENEKLVKEITKISSDALKENSYFSLAKSLVKVVKLLKESKFSRN